MDRLDRLRRLELEREDELMEKALMEKASMKKEWMEDELMEETEENKRKRKGQKSIPEEELRTLQREFIFSAEQNIKEAKREEIRGMKLLLQSIDGYIFYLKNYEKLVSLGARTSPGLLLNGKPGMGKTLTARHIISETGVRAIDVNSFPRRSSYWTKDDIKALFGFARDYVKEKGKPIILFWDEFETVGRERMKGPRGAAEVTNALTTEIDGLGGKSLGVILIATTNYERYLDYALLRPGRIGEHISFNYPTREGKEEILRYYAEKKPSGEIDFRSISYLLSSTTTPAEIEELVEKVYLNACMKSIDEPENAKIENGDLIELIIGNIMGTPADIWLSEKEHFGMAVHETGHAVLARLLGLPTQLTIALSSGYGRGTTVHINDSMSLRKFGELLLITRFGGTAADGLFGYESFDEGDRSSASQIAFNIVAEDFEGADTSLFGDSSCGNGNFSPLSNDLRVEIEEQAFELLKSAEEKARSIIESYGKEGINRIARALVKRGFLVQRELDDLMEHDRT